MNDLAMARDFDLGMMGPPLAIPMDFIAGGLRRSRGRVRRSGAAVRLALVAAAAAAGRVVRDPLAAARERGVEGPQHRRGSHRATPCRLRLPVGGGRLAGQGAAVLRARRLGDGPLRHHPHAASTTCSTRRRSCVRSSVLACLVVVAAANLVVFWILADAAADGRLSTARVVVFVQASIGVASIAFGGLNWALDGASAPVAALKRLEAQGRCGGSAPRGVGAADAGSSAPEIRFRDVTSATATALGRCSMGSTSPSPRARRWPSSARTVRARPPSPSCCAGCTTRTSGTIQVDGQPLHRTGVDSWRRQVTAVFQDFIRFELPLRTNVCPDGCAATRSSAARSPTPAPADLAGASTPCFPRATRAAPTCRVGSGSGSRLPGRCAPFAREPGWCCSTNRPPNSTFAVRRRSSNGCCRRPGRHDDPDLASVLDRSARRPDRRDRGRQADRVGHPRRADRDLAAATARCSNSRLQRFGTRGRRRADRS